MSDSDNAPLQEARWGSESITWSRSPGGRTGTATAITPKTPVSYSTIVSTPGLRKGVALKNVLGSCNDSLQTGTGCRVDLNLDLARPSMKNFDLRVTALLHSSRSPLLCHVSEDRMVVSGTRLVIRSGLLTAFVRSHP